MPTWRARQAPATYMYEFAWRSPQFDGRLVPAMHWRSVSSSIPWDTPTQRLYGAEPPQQLADTMHRGWVSFASTGDPGPPADQLGRRQTMHFDHRSEMIDDPRRPAKIWNARSVASAPCNCFVADAVD